MLLWSLRSSRGKSLGSSQELSKHKSFLGYAQGFLGPSLYVGAFQSPYSSEYLILQLFFPGFWHVYCLPHCYFLPQVVATLFTCLSMFLMNIFNAATSPPRESLKLAKQRQVPCIGPSGNLIDTSKQANIHPWEQGSLCSWIPHWECGLLFSATATPRRELGKGMLNCHKALPSCFSGLSFG